MITQDQFEKINISWMYSDKSAWSPALYHQSLYVKTNPHGLALSMFWHCQCFGTVNILERFMFWRSRTNAGERQSLRDLIYQSNFYTDCTKTLTVPKHRPNRYTDNDGPKGYLVPSTKTHSWYFLLSLLLVFPYLCLLSIHNNNFDYYSFNQNTQLILSVEYVNCFSLLVFAQHL